MSTIPVLPPEVISLILDFLTFRERLALSTVCKQWHDLVFGIKLIQKMVLRVSFGKDLLELQHSLPYQRCRRVQIECRGMEGGKVDLVKHLLQESPVQHLTVTGSDVEMKSLLEDSLPSMSRLVSLDIRCKSESDTLQTLANSNLESVTFRGALKFVPQIDINFPALKSITIHQGDDGGTVIIPNTDSFAEIDLFHFDGKYHCYRDFAQVFEKMVSMKRLRLDHTIIDSTQLHVLTSLTDLRLMDTKTEFASWKKAIAEMKQLKTLHLVGFTFTESSLPSISFASDSVTEFNFYPGTANDTILADFPNLKNMTYISNEETTPQMFEQICSKYQKLQRLSFGLSGGQFGTFLTESSIAHINKLPSLKILQLVRMFLDNVDWSQCHRNQLQKIRLLCSPIDGHGAQKLAATFPGLSELFLDYCYLRQPAEAFEIAENCSEEQALRRRLPRCRISYYDCHVEALFDTCSGRRHGSNGLPS